MIRITLDDNQAQSLQSTNDSVELCDREGKLLGYVARNPTALEIDVANSRLDSTGPWYSTDQVLNHLNSVDQG